MVGMDALDPPQQRATQSVEARLLLELADDGLPERLTALDPPAGYRPPPLARASPPPHEQEAVVIDDDGTHAHLGPCHHGSALCTTSARAVKPNVSKKFFVLRLPGSASASTPTQPRSVHQATTASTRTSPTPTSRPSGST